MPHNLHTPTASGPGNTPICHSRENDITGGTSFAWRQCNASFWVQCQLNKLDLKEFDSQTCFLLGKPDLQAEVTVPRMLEATLTNCCLITAIYDPFTV